MKVAQKVAQSGIAYSAVTFTRNLAFRMLTNLALPRWGLQPNMKPEEQLHQAMLQMESSTRMLHHFGIGLILLYGFLFLLALAGTAFWIWMLVDCIKRKKDGPLIGWVLLIACLNFPGAIVYYFAGRNVSSSDPNVFADSKSVPTGNVFKGGSSRSETISKVEPSPGGLTVYFEGGEVKTFHWMDFPTLLNVHKEQRAKWQLSSDRKEIIWPELQQRLDYAALFLR